MVSACEQTSRAEHLNSGETRWGKLDGRTALITGASRGIGRAITKRFAAEGADVAINYASNAVAAQEVADTVQQLGRQARIYQADVADEAASVRMCDAAIADFGQIDILVNNAGLGSATINRPAIADATNEQWQLLLDVNLWGPIYLCRKLLPHMRQADRSDIVMISSIAAQALNPGYGRLFRQQSSAGSHGTHTGPGRETARYAGQPDRTGLVDTDMGRRIVEATGANMHEVNAASPFGFVCTPDDIAATAMHLCSEDGRYITNQRITISGG